MTDLIEQMAEAIRKNSNKGVAGVFYIEEGGVSKHYNTACHAMMSSNIVQKSPILGNALISNPDFKQETKSLFEFLYGNQSPYWPLIKAMGNDFIKVYDKQDNPKGFIINNPKYNRFILTNFLKSIRTFKEHSRTLLFWKKWHMDQGIPGGLSWLLSYYYDQQGQKINPSHGPLELKEVDLRKFIDPDHNLWDLSEYVFSKSDGAHYSGENKITWGVKDRKFAFDPHKIRKASTKTQELETHFYKMYFVEPPNRVTDEDLKQFFKDAIKSKGQY